jgi:glutamate racemase
MKKKIQNEKSDLFCLDSGIGGLSVVAAIAAQYPSLSMSYVADHAYMPYGDRTSEVIAKRVEDLVAAGIERWNPRAILLACNTATAVAIDRLRQKFSLPFIGVEPFVNAVNLHPELFGTGKKGGVILTPLMAQSSRFRDLLKRLDPEKHLSIFPCPYLAGLIEELFKARGDKNKQHALLQDPRWMADLGPVQEANLTSLVLGCTHYPLVAQHIENIVQAKTINNALAIAKRTGDILQLKAESQNTEAANFFFASTSLSPMVYQNIQLSTFLNHKELIV